MKSKISLSKEHEKFLRRVVAGCDSTILHATKVISQANKRKIEALNKLRAFQ